MNRIHNQKLNAILTPIADFCLEYSTNGDLALTVNQMKEGGIRKVNAANFNKLINTLAGLNLFIQAIYRLNNTSFDCSHAKTLKGGNIPKQFIPEAFKINLSKKDDKQFDNLHYKLQEFLLNVKNFILDLDLEGSEFTISIRELMNIGTFCLDIYEMLNEIMYD